MTITLTDELEELINEKVRSGAYKSADEVVTASLRLLKAKVRARPATPIIALREAIEN